MINRDRIYNYLISKGLNKASIFFMNLIIYQMQLEIMELVMVYANGI